MSRLRLASLFVVALTVALVLPAAAQEEVAGSSPDSAQDAPSADEIAALIAALDSDRFADRQAASEKLAEIGQAAIPALTEAAGGESLEVTVRSIDVLRKLAESEDAKLKEASKAALEKIAQGDRPSAARRAQDALKALEPAQARPNALMPGVIQFNVAAVAGARRVSVKTVNGVKEINAEEGDRKVKIVDDPKAGIKMEVTTKKNGQDVTEKYEAKNEEDLKKNHPEAHKIYKQYDQGGGAVMVQMQVAGGPIRIGPAKIAQPQRPNRLDMAGRMITAWGSSLKHLANDEAIKEANDATRKDLSTKVAELKEQLSDIEKRLEKAPPKEEKAEEKQADAAEPAEAEADSEQPAKQ